ncbi:MAG: SRPBCC family protein [Balneolaceae bacterium]|nr:SRPBCC family protein [Balneolaceae bacterium]
MSKIIIIKTVHAPVELVFNTIADIRNFSEAVPDIVDVQFLSEIKSGVGTRFRETRLVKGKEATEEMEVTEYVENDCIRIIAESHGTIWDSLFTVAGNSMDTELKLKLEAKANTLLAKMINPMMKGMIKKAIGKDMNAVKRYCEAHVVKD